MVGRNFCDKIKDREISLGGGPNPQELRQQLLAKLIDLDFAYNRECLDIDRTQIDASARERQLKELRSRHRRRRQFLIDKLTFTQRPVSKDVDGVPDASSASILCAQETNILRLLMQGAKTSEAAARLSLDAATVKAYIKSILEKVSAEDPQVSIIGKVQRNN